MQPSQQRECADFYLGSSFLCSGSKWPDSSSQKRSSICFLFKLATCTTSQPIYHDFSLKIRNQPWPRPPFPPWHGSSQQGHWKIPLDIATELIDVSRMLEGPRSTVCRANEWSGNSLEFPSAYTTSSEDVNETKREHGKKKTVLFPWMHKKTYSDSSLNCLKLSSWSLYNFYFLSTF